MPYECGFFSSLEVLVAQTYGKGMGKYEQSERLDG